MSRYAIVNLMDVKESVSGMADGIEGRFARSLLDSRELGVSHFRYAPSYRSPLAHSHREQEEAYVIIAGSGRALLDGEVIDLAQWDVLRIAPEVVRTFEAGAGGLEMIAVGTRRPEGGDGVRATATWPDDSE